MKGEIVPQDVKEEIWIRDEFSCKSCGKTLNWEDLKIGCRQEKDDERDDAGDRRCLRAEHRVVGANSVSDRRCASVPQHPNGYGVAR